MPIIFYFYSLVLYFPLNPPILSLNYSILFLIVLNIKYLFFPFLNMSFSGIKTEKEVEYEVYKKIKARGITDIDDIFNINE